MKKKTFTEIYEPSWKILEVSEEEKSADILVKVSAVIQEADIINGNNRVYPLDLLTREVKKLQIKVSKRKLFSSLDHTMSSYGALRTTAAVITKLWIEGARVFGEFDVLNTNYGKDLAVLLRASEVGISSRGMGSSKEQVWKGKKADIMQSDYKLIGFDFVTEGSVKDAVPYKVEHEEEGDMDIIKTMEDFKKALPEEYKKLQEQIAEELSKKFEAKLAEKLAEVKKTTEEEVKKSMAEENEKINTELESKRTVIDKIIEVFKEEGILEIESDEDIDKGKTDLKKKIGDLEIQLKEKDTNVSTLQDEVDKLKVAKYGEKKLEDEKFKDILSEKIKEAKTEKEVDEIIEREKKSIEEVLKVKKEKKENKEEDLKGKGKTSIEELNANKKEQQRLAGIQE